MAARLWQRADAAALELAKHVPSAPSPEMTHRLFVPPWAASEPTALRIRGAFGTHERYPQPDDHSQRVARQQPNRRFTR